jgi:antitoxin (DNA-binding transcriptional repressor) of toxin-antitoxin stability system
MKDIRELLQDADPLPHELPFPGQHDFRRQAVLAAVSAARAPARVGSRSRMAVIATVALTVIAASVLGSRVWSVFVGDLQAAAVRFEVRLAEDSPAPGLREAKVGSDRSVYLHDEVIVTNGDIAVARVVPGQGPSEYSVGIEFKPAGAEKMRAATGNHIGKLLAILLDGRVVMAPVLRSPISASARITGNFTRPQAERIVNGIQIQ